MARITVGGTADDYLFVTRADRSIALPAGTNTLTWWTAETGGTQLTGLLLNGQTVNSIPIPTSARIPAHQWPDGVTEAWADAGGGRVLYRRTTTSGGTSGPAAIADVTGLQTALDGKAPSSALVPTLNAQTGTTYAPVLTDGNNTLVTFTNAAAIAVTLPTNAAVAFPIGTTLQFKQLGAGAVTVAPAGTVTQAPATLSTSGPGQEIWATKTGTNTWSVILLGASSSGGGGGSSFTTSTAMIACTLNGASAFNPTLFEDNIIPCSDTEALRGTAFEYVDVTISNTNSASSGLVTKGIRCKVAAPVLFDWGVLYNDGATGVRAPRLYLNQSNRLAGGAYGPVPAGRSARINVQVGDVFTIGSFQAVASKISGFGVSAGDTFLAATLLPPLAA